jgi:catalase
MMNPGAALNPRRFSYGDAQRYRLGVNFNHIPVNARSPSHSYHRDGAMRTHGNLFRLLDPERKQSNTTREVRRRRQGGGEGGAPYGSARRTG